MIIYNFDKIVRVKFLLPAGFAESNTSLNTVFNQHRSSFYNSFCHEFNSYTENLPADLLLPTNVYIPLPGSSVDVCRFDICTPKTSFFLKKLNVFSSYYDLNLFSINLSVLDLFKLSCIKSIHFNLLYKHFLYKFFSTFLHSLLSFNSLKKKNIIFFIIRLENVFGVSFYRIKFNNDFKRLFFIL